MTQRANQPGLAGVWRVAAALGIAAFLPLGALGVDCDHPNDITGPIQLVDQMHHRIQVNGIDVGTDGQTELRGFNGDSIPFSSLAPGQGVDVDYCGGPGTPMGAVARRIRQRTADTPSEVELHGQVSSRSADGSFHLNGIVTVVTNGSTEFLDRDGHPTTYDAVQDGLFVDAKGAFQPTGSLLASRIKVNDSGGYSVHFAGLIGDTDAGAGTFTLNGGIHVSTATGTDFEYNGNDGTFADVQDGRFAEVEGTATAPGQVAAREVRIHDAETPSTNFVLLGSVTGVDPSLSQFTVRDVDLTVNGDTVFLAVDGQPEAFADIAVADNVEVHGRNVPASATDPARKLATLVRELPSAPINDLIEVHGAASSIDAPAGTFVVADKTIRTDNSTLYFDQNFLPTDFSAITDGAPVNVHGQLQPDGSVNARVVRLLPAPNTGGDVEFHGLLTGIDADTQTFMVNARPVLTDSNTVFLADDGSSLTFGDFAVLDAVEVKGTARTDGVVLASQIKREHDGPTNVEVEFTGRIDSITLPTLVVVDPHMSRIVEIAADTVLLGPGGATITPNDLAVDQIVEVKGTVNPAIAGPMQIVHATRIKVEDHNDHEAEAAGRIDSIDSANASFVLHGITIHTNGDTTYFDARSHAAIAFADLQVGNFVEVRGTFEVTDPAAGPAILANRVTRKASDDTPHPGVVAGLVDSLDQTSQTLVVRGILVLTSANTQYLDTRNNASTFADLTVGTPVAVEGRFHPETHSIDATIIRQLLPPSGEHEVEFLGPITAIDGNGGLAVGGRTVATTDTTQYFDADGNAITYGDLQVDQLVEVKGTIDGAGLITASRIRVHNPVCIEIRFSGRLDEKADALWVVAGRPVAITSSTKFRGPHGATLTAADFTVGDAVGVDACLSPDGGLTARVIRKGVPAECEDGAELVGPISAIQADTTSFDVNDVHVVTNAQTRFIGTDHQDITFADLQTSDTVKVRGQVADDGSVNACEVRKLDPTLPPALPNRVRGAITAIDSANTTITVQDTVVDVTSDTLIRARRDEHLTFDDLAVGQLVEALGRSLPDGTFVANRIRLHEENEVPDHDIVIHGLASNNNGVDQLTVGDLTVTVDANTQIEGFEDTPATLADIANGDFVRVEGVPTATPGVIAAKEIEIRLAVLSAVDQAASTVTAVDTVFTVDALTEIREAAGTALGLADLAVGDRVRIEGDNSSGSWIATAIVRFGTFTASSHFDGFTSTVGGRDQGRPTITSVNNQNTFGFVSLPNDSFTADLNSLYEIRVRVTSNVADRSQVPVMRLRVNMAGYEKATNLIIDPTGDSRFVATSNGFLYSFLFVPPSGNPNLNTTDRRFFVSLDMMSFSGRSNVAQAKFRLDSVQALPVDVSRVHVLQTLANDTFVGGTSGWVYGNVASVFTPAVAGAADAGSLDLAATDRNTFGFWTKNLDATLLPGHVYRGRFLVNTGITDQSRVPQLRVRLNSYNQQIAQVNDIVSNNSGLESPTPEARVYDVYLSVPSNASADKVVASFDLLNFLPDDQLNGSVSLQQFLLEEVSIN